MKESPASVEMNEKPIGKSIDVGGRDDNDDDDCSCRTDLTTVRASNTRPRRILVRVNPNVLSSPRFPVSSVGNQGNNTSSAGYQQRENGPFSLLVSQPIPALTSHSCSYNLLPSTFYRWLAF
jgi:hypothetical protein